MVDPLGRQGRERASIQSRVRQRAAVRTRERRRVERQRELEEEAEDRAMMEVVRGDITRAHEKAKEQGST